MASPNTFSGNPKTEWLSTPLAADRDMKLLDDFSFTDPNGRVWLAPQGTLTDGASIPQALWSAVGSPFTGDYRCAAVVHDAACSDPSVSRREADRMFYQACLAGGCSLVQARILYIGVRIGAAFGQGVATSTAATLRGAPDAFALAVTADSVLSTYHRVLSNVASKNVDSFDELERAVDESFGLA